MTCTVTAERPSPSADGDGLTAGIAAEIAAIAPAGARHASTEAAIFAEKISPGY